MAVDIVIQETIDSVDITVNPNIIEVNVTRTSGGGGAGSQTLAQTLDNGNQTGGENILVNNADAIELENGSLLQKGTYNYDGAGGGISRICSVGYEDMWQSGIRYVFDNNGLIRNSTNGFDVIPDGNFDVTNRFKVGSFWTLDNGDTYICTDATEGAAVWEIYSVAGIPTLQEVVEEGNTTTSDIIVNSAFGTDSANLASNQITILDVDDYSYLNKQELGFGNNTDEQLSTYGVNYIGFITSEITSTSVSFENPTSMNSIIIPDKSGTLATTIDIPTKTSDLINDGDNGTSHFISLEDLPSTLTLYPTTTASGIGGYNRLVTSITDPIYNATAVDVSTGAITGTDQFIAGLITNAGLIIGNPGIFNMTTIGNIRKTAGSGQAEFYFTVYKRDAGGTETFILQSSNTTQITSAIYTEFNASGLWNDGVFVSTDRIVLKFYGTKVGSGSNPTYDFQFGGAQPIRSIVPVPLNVIPVITLDELTDVTITTATNNQLLAYTSATDIWENKNLIDILKNFNRTQGIYFFEDFLGTNDNAGIVTSIGVTMSAVGTGSGARITGVYPNRTNQQGVVQLATGTTTSGGASFRLGSANTPTFFVGSGAISCEVYINIETLSTLANRFVNVFGFYTGPSITTSNNLISFIYDEGGVFASGGIGASPNWKCVTGNGGVRTSTNSSIVVTASAWTKLRIEINANATSVQFYINDTLVATNASNIPATTTGLYFLNGIQKTTGTTSINIYGDYFSLEQNFTTAR